MTAARGEQPGVIPAQSWTNGVSTFVLDALAPGDEYLAATCVEHHAAVMVGEENANPRATFAFNAQQLRELAAAALERADHLDNVAGRNRKTPAWHIREGEGRLMTARFLVNTSDRFELARAQAAIASAHFTAAVALRGLTTHPQVVVHNHTEPSGKDTE